jgi:hypothetical protein
MYKNSALLSIGAALVFSLFCIDAGLAGQIDKNQDACILMAREMKGTANLSIKQISNTPTPCGGRTGASCRKDSPAGSGAMATDGSRYTITTSASAAGMLFGTSFIVLVAIGARRLRHHHEHHALRPSDRACRAQLASLVDASRARASESNSILR